MTKTKVVGSIGTMLAITLIAGGVYFYSSQQPRTEQLGASFDSRQASSDQAPAGANAPHSSNSISLNQTFDTPEASALKAGSNSGMTSATQAAGTQQPQQTLGQSTSNEAGSPSQANPFDPASFAQYDKYKNDKGALFSDVQAGTGTALAADKKAAVYYRGWLTNGSKFDESHMGSDGKLAPFVFTLGAHQVITGWEQALAGMKVGGVRLLVIPPAVGYGASAQANIPANSVLIFQVQLAEVQ